MCHGLHNRPHGPAVSHVKSRTWDPVSLVGLAGIFAGPRIHEDNLEIIFRPYFSLTQNQIWQTMHITHVLHGGVKAFTHPLLDGEAVGVDLEAVIGHHRQIICRHKVVELWENGPPHKVAGSYTNTVVHEHDVNFVYCRLFHWYGHR